MFKSLLISTSIGFWATTAAAVELQIVETGVGAGTRTAVPVLAQLVATLLDSDDGPAPLVELFNWACQRATTNPTFEQIRDDLIDLLRICGRIRRYCTQATVHPDQAVEQINRDAIAERLEIVAATLLQESARLGILNIRRHVAPTASSHGRT